MAFLQWLNANGWPVAGYDPLESAREGIASSVGPHAVAHDLAELGDCYAVHICVPTEPSASGAADLSIIRRVVEELATLLDETSCLRVVSQRSTCPPGTADLLAEQIPLVTYGVNPSFLRKAAIRTDTEHPDRVAYAGPPAYCEHLAEIYRGGSVPSFVVESRATVELLKYAENAFDAVTISFWNELLNYAFALGLQASDFEYLLDRFGDRPKFASAMRVPGRAFGLWCLPKDLTALLAEMRTAGVSSHTLAGAATTNTEAEAFHGQGTSSSVDLLTGSNGGVRLGQAGRARVSAAFRRLRVAR